ncbi:phosphocholine cytidylyltransferase family protein [Clostridium bornimense]|uniref:phosphocholine cytidylyltransferase family protein n=1 Tax=Clostridium bornimense TaxID=1216932 RepID=UPI001C110371|nr:phosphocholine cytidylyltransferase family protein [Clostridium bornimense]MBU5314789.1 phosphocholine cytidylyltransferase family protein [Clostridium bornimense]
MQAIILNSGKGTRLGKLTKDKPKCLVKINEVDTILDRQIQILNKYGIDNILITTGYKKDILEDYIDKKDYNVDLVFNELFETTNYIYSLYKVREFIKDDVILLHGDMVFHESILKRILEGKENLVVVRKDGQLSSKDFKCEILNSNVMKIAVNLYTEKSKNCFPIYKFNKESFEVWIKGIEDSVRKNNVTIYAEEILNNLLEKGDIKLNPLYIKDEICTEVDDEEDYNYIIK